MGLENIKELFDFESFDYFYHETEEGNGERIMEEGLLVDGTNIIDTNNILFTTTVPITPDMVESSQAFIDYINSEVGSNTLRDVSEMVIICTEKGNARHLVDEFNQTINEHFYEGIIYPNYIMGYIDMHDMEFHPNEKYEFAEEIVADDSYGI